jgi:hypothetical protein
MRMQKSNIAQSWVLVLWLFTPLVHALPTPPSIAKDIIRTVHRVRSVVESPEAFLAQDRLLIERQIASLVERESELPQFASWVLGPGLLFVDEFFDDLVWIAGCASSNADTFSCRQNLDALGFSKLAVLLSRVSMDSEPALLSAPASELTGPARIAIERISRFEQASEATLSAQNAFIEASTKATHRLKTFQYSIALVASSLGVNALWYHLGLDQMTPREFVGFLFGVWAANKATYWIVWDHFKWIDPFKKWAAKKEYNALIQHWNQLLMVSPTLTAKKAAAAATTKLVSESRYADAQSDAALEAMFSGLSDGDLSNDNSIKQELFSVFLVELEHGNGARAMRVLETLRRVDPQSPAARLSDVVNRIFTIRYQMERKCLRRQVFKAFARVTLLAVGISFLNESLKRVLPPELVQWRTVPNSIVAGLGVKTILPLIWIPHRFEWLKGMLDGEEQALQEAFEELMQIDPSGEIAQRIAVYDSGRATDRVITSLAVAELAKHPTGERTRKLWNIISHELGLSRPSDDRVRELLSQTYRSQRTCVQRLLTAIGRLSE